MIVFGGKLLREKDAVDVNQSSAQAIRELSLREKSLLAELNSTRESIVSELVLMTPNLGLADLPSLCKTISSYEEKLGHSGHDRRKSKQKLNANSAVHSLTNFNKSLSSQSTRRGLETSHFAHAKEIKTGLDTLPLLDRSGDYAFNASSNSQYGTIIRLPVISLPDPFLKSKAEEKLKYDTSRINESSNNSIASTAVVSLATKMSSRAFEIPIKEKYFIQQYLKLSEDEFNEMKIKSDMLLVDRGLYQSSGSTKFGGLVTVFMLSHYNSLGLTDVIYKSSITTNENNNNSTTNFQASATSTAVMFMSAAASDTRRSSTARPSSGTSHAKSHGSLFRNKSTMNMISRHDSYSSNAFPSLSSQSVHTPMQTTFERGGQGMTLKVGEDNMNDASVCHNSSSNMKMISHSTFLQSHSASVSNMIHKKVNSQKSKRKTKEKDKEKEKDTFRIGKAKERSEGSNAADASNALRLELIKSLSDMQKYTQHVKQDILNVHNIVSVTNSKARSFVLCMASEHMASCLHALALREFRRAWNAWWLEIRYQRLRTKTLAYHRFHKLRYISQLFNNVVIKVLRKKYVQWVQYCVAEKLEEDLLKKREAALFIQRCIRGWIGRIRARKIAEANKFAKLYTALIKLQAFFRMKVYRWRYLKHLREVLVLKSAKTIQRVARGHNARRRVKLLRQGNGRHKAAVRIQAVVRGIQGRKKAAGYRIFRLRNIKIVCIQALARGYIGRRMVDKIIRDKLEFNAAVLIQSIMRRALVKMNLHRRRLELEEYKIEQDRNATKIQATYRGYRAKLRVKFMLEDRMAYLELKRKSAITIQCCGRQYIAKFTLLKRRKHQFDDWVKNASMWVEMYAEDAGNCFYYNAATEESLWEPPACGYTKLDGQLVLANGNIIDPPTAEKRSGGDICIECCERTAIRHCNECNDNYCTKCYKSSHLAGSRKNHTFEALGPLDCTECEMNLAERWCVSCDEAFCDSCWRKVHSKGKRRYHPFSEIFADGSIDSVVFTIDGEKVKSYDATYSQTRYDAESIQQSTAGFDAAYAVSINEAPAAAYNAEWVQATDDQGYEYWYNNYTGVSQYENPYQ